VSWVPVLVKSGHRVYDQTSPGQEPKCFKY